MQTVTIFTFFSDNLRLLVENGLLTVKDYQYPLYIFPICLRRYNSSADPQNPLTLEDAPPKSLGGKAHVLTCKECNNTAGHKIDFHLAERLQELDDQKFLPGTDVAVNIKIGDETFRARIKVDDKGTMSVEHSPKNNHPAKLKEAMKNLPAGTVINPEFVKSRVIPENLEYALLKSGYILAFGKYGYSLMLHPCYNIVRDQLKHPETSIYPSGFWFSPSPGEVAEGVFMITDSGYESIFVIFNVDTAKTKHTFGVILPLPIHPIAEVITRINKRVELAKQIKFTLYPDVQNQAQFITDLPNITAMHEWIGSRNHQHESDVLSKDSDNVPTNKDEGA